MFVSSSQHLFLVRICGQLQYNPSSQQGLLSTHPMEMVHKTIHLLPGAATTFPSLSLTFHFLVGMQLTGNHKQTDTSRR